MKQRSMPVQSTLSNSELIPYPSIGWYARHHCNTENIADGYRHLAIGIEETLEQDSRGVSLERPLVLIVKEALWALAERIDLDS